MVRLAIFISVMLIGILGCASDTSADLIHVPEPTAQWFTGEGRGVLSFEDDVPWDKFTPETKERMYQYVQEHDCFAIKWERYFLAEWAEEKYPDVNLYHEITENDGVKFDGGHPVNNLARYLWSWHARNCD